jgi:hypothetical protein
MGLRGRLARWLNGDALPAAPSASVAAPSLHELVARVAQLELERPAFIAELQNMLDAVDEILQRTEGKRARIAAAKSRAEKEHELPTFDPTDREKVKAAARARAPSWRREPIQ